MPEAGAARSVRARLREGKGSPERKRSEAGTAEPIRAGDRRGKEDPK